MMIPAGTTITVYATKNFNSENQAPWFINTIEWKERYFSAHYFL
jgi:hypothetical protein